MLWWNRPFSRAFFLVSGLVLLASLHCSAAPSWRGVLRDSAGNPVDLATIKLFAADGNRAYSATTSTTGQFVFTAVREGDYALTVSVAGKIWTAAALVVIKDGRTLGSGLRLSPQGQELRIIVAPDAAAPQSSGGERLSTGEVSSLPLNERDFSKLLLLAAGTMTDTNGAANFTQQFAINGADTTDPELGGATFSNFNVDAIQEVQSSSGVMPADTGHGASGFTNVVTKSGGDQVHGSLFEFVRNASFDARNFFDHKSEVDTRRLPAFARNEFGVTNGGPIVLPRIYDGRGRTFYFAEYQGFRQVLGTTQVFPVPTVLERQGIDTATFPGDTLIVPVNSSIAPLLARYPLPNDPHGAY